MSAYSPAGPGHGHRGRLTSPLPAGAGSACRERHGLRALAVERGRARRPDRTAVRRRRACSPTRELRARGARGAAALAAAASRRATGSRSRSRRASRSPIALHACLLLGAAGRAGRPAPGAGRARPGAARRRSRGRRSRCGERRRRSPIVRAATTSTPPRSSSTRSGTTGAPEAGRADATATGCGARSARRSRSASTRRALAVPAAAQPRRRPRRSCCAARSTARPRVVHERFDADARARALRDAASRSSRSCRRRWRGCSTPGCATPPGAARGRCSAAARRRRPLLERARGAGVPVAPTYGLTRGAARR